MLKIFDNSCGEKKSQLVYGNKFSLIINLFIVFPDLQSFKKLCSKKLKMLYSAKD